MKPFPHEYRARLTGGPVGAATVSAPGMPDIESAPPAEFDGPGDAWSPEHLFLAAIEACFLLTLRTVARASQLEFTSLDVEVVGVVDRQDRITRFTEIVLRPRLTVRRTADCSRAIGVLEKTERACLVSASISTPVRLEPEIVGGSHRESAA
jgi:organic hydroperoxide reductase OsmC/OhrA